MSLSKYKIKRTAPDDANLPLHLVQHNGLWQLPVFHAHVMIQLRQSLDYCRQVVGNFLPTGIQFFAVVF